MRPTTYSILREGATAYCAYNRTRQRTVAILVDSFSSTTTNWRAHTHQDSDAFKFGKDSIIPPQDRLLGCKENNGGNFSFAFGIGGDDTVSLYTADLGLLDTKSIAGSSEAKGWLWQRTADLGNWSYAPYQTGLLGSPPPPPTPKGGIFAYHELKCKTCHAMGLPYSVRTETCMAMGAWKDDVSGPFAVIWNGQVPVPVLTFHNSVGVLAFACARARGVRAC